MHFERLFFLKVDPLLLDPRWTGEKLHICAEEIAELIFPKNESKEIFLPRKIVRNTDQEEFLGRIITKLAIKASLRNLFSSLVAHQGCAYLRFP